MALSMVDKSESRVREEARQREYVTTGDFTT